MQRLAAISSNLDAATKASEFVALAKYLMIGGGSFERAIHEAGQAKAPGRVVSVLKEASLFGGVSREVFQKAAQSALTSGSGLADYSIISAGFVNSLQAFGVFDSMLSSMIPLPVNTATVGNISVSAQAYSLGEGSAKPLARLSVANQQMNPFKAHVIVTISEELARSPLVAASQLLARELKNAVAVATDAQFIAAISSGISAATSVGATAEAVRNDIAGLLRSVTLGQGSKPFLLTTSLIAKMLSVMPSTSTIGEAAFPQMGPQGGFVCNIPTLVSDGVPSGDLILIDASGVGAGSGEVTLQEMREASIQADSSPDSPATSGTSLINLWQMNLRGVVVERFFTAVRLRSDAVAITNNPNSYQTGFSP
jgi:Phage capsid family